MPIRDVTIHNKQNHNLVSPSTIFTWTLYYILRNLFDFLENFEKFVKVNYFQFEFHFAVEV